MSVSFYKLQDEELINLFVSNSSGCIGIVIDTVRNQGAVVEISYGLLTHQFEAQNAYLKANFKSISPMVSISLDDTTPVVEQVVTKIKQWAYAELETLRIKKIVLEMKTNGEI